MQAEGRRGALVQLHYCSIFSRPVLNARKAERRCSGYTRADNVQTETLAVLANLARKDRTGVSEPRQRYMTFPSLIHGPQRHQRRQPHALLVQVLSATAIRPFERRRTTWGRTVAKRERFLS